MYGIVWQIAANYNKPESYDNKTEIYANKPKSDANKPESDQRSTFQWTRYDNNTGRVVVAPSSLETVGSFDHFLL